MPCRSENWLSSSGCLVAEAWGGEGYYDNFGQIDHYNLLRLCRTYEAIKTGYKIGTLNLESPYINQMFTNLIFAVECMIMCRKCTVSEIV
jgi:hypothetical protein